MQIYRAEDGEAFHVNKTVGDIEKKGLGVFLHEVTGVDEAAVLAYLSDGRRLRDENLRELGGIADQSIFVFNKHYLDYELDHILHKLRVDPPLQSEVKVLAGGQGNIESMVTIGTTHYNAILDALNSIRVQHQALRIASTSLDLNVLSISDVFESFAGGARRELDKQMQLLRGLDLDLEVISKIQIHPEFLSPAVRRAVEAGEKARTLGDYVSNVKMRQVGEACSKTHYDLLRRFKAVEESVNHLSSGADNIRASILDSGLVEEAQSCLTRSREALERITEVSSQLREPRKDEAELFTEIEKDEVALRDEIRLVFDVKNKSTALCLKSLRQISHLNNDLVLLPPTLSTLQGDFRAKTNFAHIQRLHNMLYAYGATLVEIVRRKEFSRFFSHRAQTIAEIMAKLSASERKRRQIYRGEVHGQLPFDTKGMDESIPTMEITSKGVTATSDTYSLERSDLVSLLDELEKIEQARWTGEDADALAHNPLRETRNALEKLITRMDTLDTTFDKMAEKTIFSSSRILLPRRQTTDHTDTEFQEVIEQFHDLQDAKSEQERLFEDDRRGLRAEVERLRSALQEANELSIREQERADRLEDETQALRFHKDNLDTAHRDLDERHAELLVEVNAHRESLAEAQDNVTQKSEEINVLRQDLARAVNDTEETKRLEADHTAGLIGEHQEVVRMLREANEDADRRLRAQASEADRILRDIIAEADGDRAVLEHQCFELRGRLGVAERELKEARSEIDVLNADVTGLREELQRGEHELGAARNVEDTLRNDLRSSQGNLSRYQSLLEGSERLAKDLLRVANTFRESHAKALLVAHSSSSSSKSIANLADSASLPKPVETPPIDLDDPAAGLRILQEFDLTTLNDIVAKTGSTIRKWQKQCKEYRDRAKGKISFRNFAKGDLALFLPTRNSISKPWAAFNVSFPHYFLQANNNLAEQLKVREWVVARITSISEHIADNRIPSSNPYGLADGTKFYMLQVEDWTQSSPSGRRKTSPQVAPKAPAAESLPRSSSTPGTKASDHAATEVSASTSTSPQKLETPTPASTLLLKTRQRTYSAPIPQASSLSKLLAQEPPNEERKSSPSPVSISPPASPPAGPPHIRPPSALASPPRPRPTSPLTSPPLVNPSLLTGPFQPRPSSYLAGPSHSRPSPPLFSSQAPPASPPAESSDTHPPSPYNGPVSDPSPSQASPISTKSPLHLESRRSSSSSRPSSVFSALHPLHKSNKAAATTALSGTADDPIGVSPPTARTVPSPARSREDRAPATPSPEGSPTDGMAGVLLARRRTTSASTHRSSPLGVPANAVSGSALSSLANSWGAAFGRKKSTKHSPQPDGTNASTRSSTNTTRTHRTGASDILKRFDDILPHER